MQIRILYALGAVVLALVLARLIGPVDPHAPLTVTGRTDAEAYNGIVSNCIHGYDIVKDRGYTEPGVYSVTVRCK